MKWNKWWTIGLCLILVAGAGGGGYWWWSKKDDKPLQAALQTTLVRKGNLESSVSGTGNIEAANRATLTSSSSGTIESVKVKQGDKVKKGQVLATFEPNDESDNTETQIKSKKLDLEKQMIDLEDLQTQYKEAPDDDKRAQLAVSIKKQELDIQSTKETIADLENGKEDALDPITAPIDGTLATFDIHEGDSIGGQGGKTSNLGEVVDFDHLQMVVGIDELDIPQVKLDQEASIVVEALSDQTFTGKVTAIADEGTPSNGVSTFDVTITIDKAENLKAGMSAEAKIVTAKKENTLYLPIEAVQSFGGQYSVMVPSAGGTGSAAGSASSNPRQGQGTASQGQQNQGQTQGQSQGQAPQGQALQGQAQQGQNAQGQAPQGQAQQGQQAQGGFAQRQGQQGQNGGFSRQNRQAGAFAQSGVSRVQVQVGIHNEDYIEIVSGLQEGQAVVVPTTAGGSQTNQAGIPGAGIGGFGVGGPGGVTGGFVGGGFGGGNNNRTTRVQGSVNR
ncbi:efflux RND transporter periplasmic adaptor subunit [Cohnella caldifontis]|uniref:efflux RND transporter periplasmic adaptor subunit n=1 Tax=Cohnella caldifontis TaxID=3027471 RepID=UPI0023EDB799|nr:efflux RND transporter periplasmic adaptor subunit [Cohnella sp. YIM B05605]